MIVVATKLDATTNPEHLEELRAFAAKRGLEFHSISSASGAGIVELVRAMANILDRLPKPAPTAEASEQAEEGFVPDAQKPHDLPEAENHAAAPHREES